jgi:protein-disulfide isomerase
MQSRRQLRVLGASALAALVVVAIAIAISQGGSDDGGSGSTGKGAGGQTAAQLFEGIPQHGTRLGDPNAPVRMVEFVDLQCPFCKEYTLAVLPTLVKRYVRNGKLAIDLQPLAFLGEDSSTAAKALASAVAHNRGWQFADAFYDDQGAENSGYVTPAFLRSIARKAGVSPRQAVVASRSPVMPPLLTQAAHDANRSKVSGTPSFLLGRRGQPLKSLEVSELQPKAFTDPIDSLLAQ